MRGRSVLPARRATHLIVARLVGRHKLFFTRSNQFTQPHLSQGLANERPVVGIVIAKQRFVQPPFLGTGPQVAALLMIAQMLLGMAAGMIAVWWLADRSQSVRAPELAAVGEGGE